MSDWREKAACKGIAHNPDFNPDEDPFYDPPEREDGGDKWEYARAMCARCPAWVRQACLDDALRTEGKGGSDRAGFRGGHTQHQRRRISLGLPATPKKRERKAPLTPAEAEDVFATARARTPVALRRRNEWVDNIIDLLDLGLTGPDILNRLSRRSDGVFKRLERAGRLDVWERLGIPQNYTRKAS
jgi:hypothetical protein